MSVTRLLVATRNQGKMREYRELLREVPLELVSLDDLGIPDEVDETGDTFEANAILKASAYANLGGLLTLSDDSGLEVDALGGAPGVLSARYGGDAYVTDEARVQLLLRNLAGALWERRTARFRCVIAICRPGRPNASLESGPESGPESGLEASVVGSVAGMIQYEPQGDNGFGYDPVFYLPAYHQTLAQISEAEKNRISHRGNATLKAVPVLQQLAGKT